MLWEFSKIICKKFLFAKTFCNLLAEVRTVSTGGGPAANDLEINPFSH
jgi:hypothetical protein